MDDRTEAELALLRRLETAAAGSSQFTADEVAMIREAIKAYEGFRAFGRGARFVVVALGLLAAGIAAWETIATRVKAWLAG